MIAYLILAHAWPEQVIRNIEALRPSAVCFVLHVDRASGEDVMRPLRAYAAGHHDVLLAPRRRSAWASYGIVEATLACIRTLLASGKPFDYAVLMSGQDYPIKPAESIKAFFQANAGRQHIAAYSLDEQNPWTHLSGRYQAMARVTDLRFRMFGRDFPLPWKPRFPLGWRPHGGSQWWALSHAAIEWVDRTLLEEPSIERSFRYSFIPDEIMMQTMIANSPFREHRDGEPFHYVDWARPNPKPPRVLDDEDFERLAAAPHLFARKVHPVQSRGLLARIDDELLR